MRVGRRGGFTLLEALAAVVTLGLLAAAVVPLLRQLGRLSVAERLQAQACLRTLAPPGEAASANGQAIAGHPGWRLVLSDLSAGPEAAPPPGSPPAAGPAHRWRLLSIQADASGETLAETLVAVLDPP